MYKFTHPQAIQYINEFVSSSEHIWINVALPYLFTNGCSAVNGCRQNKVQKAYKNNIIIHNNPNHSSPSINILCVCIIGIIIHKVSSSENVHPLLFSHIKIHWHICLDQFFTCKLCLIFASVHLSLIRIFSAILEDSNLHRLVYYKHTVFRFINWLIGFMRITCGSLWCFYHWWHPFTAEDPLVNK